MVRFLTLLGVAILSQSVSAAIFGENLKITADRIQFRHQPIQMTNDLICTHVLAHELSQDWDVVCKDKNDKIQRQYSVHLWVSRYTHTSGPKVSYETLYWVDDRTTPKDVKQIGSTIWFHLKDETSLHSLQVNQFVDNGMASLELEFVPLATP